MSNQAGRHRKGRISKLRVSPVPNVRRQHQSQFLGVVAQNMCRNTGRISPESVADWMGVHRLSNMWNFTKVRRVGPSQIKQLIDASH